MTAQSSDYENKLTHWLDTQETSGEITKHEILFTLRQDYNDLMNHQSDGSCQIIPVPCCFYDYGLLM